MNSSSIPFNKPFYTGQEVNYIRQVTSGEHTPHTFIKKATQLLSQITGQPRILLTHSCTGALEMAAILANIQEGDEVILPSFTFVSAANAFVLRGARMVFVDLDPNTMNVDPYAIQSAITSRTKLIVVMHYGGWACDMDKIMHLAQQHKIMVVEDAAHCIGATWKGRHLGTIGHLGTISFHHTKNAHCMEGGALLINDETLWDRANTIYEKGTNRHQFTTGLASFYTWTDIGSSFGMSDLNAAFLLAQLEQIEQINATLLTLYDTYNQLLEPLAETQKITLPHQPENTLGNGHIFYLKTHKRDHLIQYLNQRGIQAQFHYIPLHSAPAGQHYGAFHGEDRHTTLESQRLLRLPLYMTMDKSKIEHVIDCIHTWAKL